jgi:hypothetical protein
MSRRRHASSPQLAQILNPTVILPGSPISRSGASRNSSLVPGRRRIPQLSFHLDPRLSANLGMLCLAR